MPAVARPVLLLRWAVVVAALRQARLRERSAEEPAR